MKTLYVLLFLIFLFGKVYPQVEEPPKCNADFIEQQKNWKKISGNRVHTRTTWKYEIIEGALTQNRERFEVFTFANSGHLIEVANFELNDNIKSIVSFEYDNHGKLSKRTGFDPTGEIIEQILYTYAPQGNLHILTRYSGNKQVLERAGFQLLSDKQIIKATWFSPDNKPYKRIDYYYSSIDTGAVMTETHYQGSDELKYTLYKYYNQGKQTVDSVFNAAGIISHKYKYLYSPAGFLSEIQKWSPRNDLLGREVYQHNESGLVISFTAYDERGNMRVFVKYGYTFY